jgi:hypothetical protein
MSYTNSLVPFGMYPVRSMLSIEEAKALARMLNVIDSAIIHRLGDSI